MFRAVTYILFSFYRVIVFPFLISTIFTICLLFSKQCLPSSHATYLFLSLFFFFFFVELHINYTHIIRREKQKPRQYVDYAG